MPQLIDLAQNRRLIFRQGGRPYSLIVAPIPATAWLEDFFDAIAAVTRCGQREIESHIDARTAGLKLLEKTAVRAEGYEGLEGNDGWLSKIPLQHRLTFSEMLIEVYELDGSSPPASASDGTRSVQLQALWGISATGAMCRYRNLVHHFKAPSVQQKGQFHRAYSEVQRAVSAARRSAPVFLTPLQPLAARTLASLYDELIVRVDGYALNGVPLDGDRRAIVQSMDTFHKFAAAQPLFTWSAARVKALRTA